MSWESNLANAALIDRSIPEESIRVRILANSDRVEDQWIKKEVRDAIVAYIDTWNLNFTQIEDARSEVRVHLPELGNMIGTVLQKYNFTYGYRVELGKVHFPAKVFGQEIYPAGEYEALRVTLGAGEGANWWCVLFPPLCFGSAIQAHAMGSGAKVVQVPESQVSPDRVYQSPIQDGDDLEVKFFLWEMSKKAGGFIKHLFA